MNPHISAHPIGTTLPLTWKATKRQHYIAKLARREHHGEVWNVYAVTAIRPDSENYLMSEGWRWVSEHASPVNPPA